MTCVLLSLALSNSSLKAQQGDREGEVQEAVERQWNIPDAPVRTPLEALDLFQLPPGYVIEAVATEPLIQDPIDCCWDASGRLWVVEMNTFMPDADGHGELEPGCSIAILSDQDNDGVFDQRTSFLDELILPRSVCLVPGGVVAILPPEIVFLQDTDGNGLPDKREVLSDQVTAGLSNPEHAANSLTLGLDNWLYVANHDRRYRRVDGSWVSERSASGGQWGMSQDDWGRLAFNYNSSCVHVNWVPPASAVRNEVFRGRGTNISTKASTEVFSSRINPGVNRGYRTETLRADGSLARLTGACGPAWFTGTSLDEADRGRLFQCEPCANLVQRYDVEDVNGEVRATLLGNAEDLDFLTSTDERFRPVNLRVGPDGSLYVVDLYRGILQHRVFLTSFLRRQAEERGLVKPHGLGRIWRIRHQEATVEEAVDLSQLSDMGLVRLLGHKNAWQRRTAQRLLVGRAVSEDVITALSHSAFDITSGMGRVHALWTLEGLGQLNVQAVFKAYRKGGDAKWMVQLLKAVAPFLKDDQIVKEFSSLPTPESREVRWQLAFSLGESQSSVALTMLMELFQSDPADVILRDAVLSSLGGREHLAMLQLPADAQEDPHQAAFLKELVQCVSKRQKLAAKRSVNAAEPTPGQSLYEATCGACHQRDGAGLTGLAPPLANSEWLSLSDEKLASLVLKGISGPIQVAGEDYDLSMPGWSSLSDQDLAAILSYVSKQWAENPHEFSAATVAKARAAMAKE
ncbi:MAG: c-type cytochrome [Planctomycetota bacterium]|nr:c-type cytochrome [Planctomycetota bacterium]MDA1113926.1 c-type cytochrome [Planctomycetota bacterium]